MNPTKLLTFFIIAALCIGILGGCAGSAPKDPADPSRDAVSGAAAPMMTTAKDTKQLRIAKGARNRQLVAHRGLKSVYPENTLPAFENSCKRGYWGVELDVYETADGEWVVLHDGTVDRTTNGTGHVSQMTLAQVKALTVDAGANIERYPGTKVPTLAEALDVFSKYQMVPIIEVKACTKGGYDTFIALLRQYGLEDRSIAASFSADILNGIRERSPSLPLMYLADITSRNIDWCAARHPALISTPHDLATGPLVQEAHQKGVSVVPYVVDSPAVQTTLMAYGADLLTTDNLAQDAPQDAAPAATLIADQAAPSH